MFAAREHDNQVQIHILQLHIYSSPTLIITDQIIKI